MFHLLKPEQIISWTFIRPSYINSIGISTQIIQFVFKVIHRCISTPFRRIWACKHFWVNHSWIFDKTSWNLSSIQVIYFKWFLSVVNSKNLKLEKLFKIASIGIYFILCSCYSIWVIIILKFFNLFDWAGIWIEQAYPSFFFFAIISIIN